MKQILGFSHNAKAMESPKEYKHLGNPSGEKSGGEYASKWGLFRQRPKAYKFRPLCNTGKKGNTKITRERMADTKYRTPPPVLVKFMAKLLQKYSTPYFAKVLVAGNKIMKYLQKYGGNLHGKRDMCMHHILEIFRKPN